MNKTKMFFALSLLVCGITCANAQSGAAQLRVFVHAGEIGNGGVQLKNVKVVMRPIDVWNKNQESVEAKSENNGNYSAGFSFGEYELTVSADNFQTYRAIVYLPASSSFTCGVRLHEIEKVPRKQKSNTDKQPRKLSAPTGSRSQSIGKPSQPTGKPSTLVGRSSILTGKSNPPTGSQSARFFNG